MCKPNKWPLAAIVACLAAAGIMASCADERPLSPRPEHYNLYSAVGASDGIRIDVVDTDTDSVTHRIPDPGTLGATTIRVSGDGKYLASINYAPGTITLFDLKTYLPIASVPTRAYNISFVPEPPRLLAFALDSTIVHNLPSLTVDAVWHRQSSVLLPSPNPGELVGFTDLWDEALQARTDGIARVDAATGELIDSFLFRGACVQIALLPFNLVLSPNGRFLYVMGGDNQQGLAVISFDLVDHSCQFRTPVVTFQSDISITPDGEEIWVTQSFSPFFRPYPRDMGYVLILDAASGQPLDTIRTLGLRTDYPEWPLPVLDIAMHPKTEKVYIGAPMSQPAMLVINTATREVESTLYDDRRYTIYSIAIAPR